MIPTQLSVALAAIVTVNLSACVMSPGNDGEAVCGTEYYFTVQGFASQPNAEIDIYAAPHDFKNSYVKISSTRARNTAVNTTMNGAGLKLYYWNRLVQIPASRWRVAGVNESISNLKVVERNSAIFGGGDHTLFTFDVDEDGHMVCDAFDEGSNDLLDWQACVSDDAPIIRVRAHSPSTCGGRLN